MSSSGPVTLKTNLAEYRLSKPLYDRAVTSDLVTLDLCGPKEAYNGFRPMLTQNAYDAGEMALATFLLAKQFNKPVTLLPAVFSGRFQHNVVSYNSDFGHMTPRDLEGKKVAVRSYTQTTGLWGRGILSSEYGVDLGKVKFLTFEDAHVDEYIEPPNVGRLPDGRTDLGNMLLEGVVDAIILGASVTPKEPQIKPIIPDPHEAAKKWHAREGYIPINHLFVINSNIARERPDVVREVWRMLNESKRLARPAEELDTMPFGFEQNRKAISAGIDFALEQKIISRRFSVDELYADAMAAIGE